MSVIVPVKVIWALTSGLVVMLAAFLRGPTNIWRITMNFARLKSMDRKYWIAAGVTLFAVLAVFALVAQLQGRGSAIYQTKPVERGTFTSSVGATGIVHARQSALLTWQTSGRLDTITVAVGDSVKT